MSLQPDHWPASSEVNVISYRRSAPCTYQTQDRIATLARGRVDAVSGILVEVEAA